MKEFRYSFFAKLIYRYANIPITILLLFYFLVSLSYSIEKWYFIFPAFINAAIIFSLNRFYFKMYRTYPFKIQANNEKLVCSDFTFTKKEIVIDFKDVERVKGGIFSGNNLKPIEIYDGKQKVQIGFNQHLKDFNKLLTIILSNVNRKLYDELLQKVKDNSFIGKIKKPGKPGS